MMSQSEIEKFKNFLTMRGAVVIGTTNEWELVRFRTASGVSVVYTNKRGDITHTGESQKAYSAFKNNTTWKAVDRKRAQLRAKKAKLAARDGKRCFVHGEKLGFDDLTVEHLLSFSHGGSDNDNNLVLVCEPANKALGNLPLAKKIEYIIAERMKTNERVEAHIAAHMSPNKSAQVKMQHTPATGDNYFHKLFRKIK
jgi:hypothetical protein